MTDTSAAGGVIEALEKATGGSRDLDAWIAVTVHKTVSTANDLIYARRRDPGEDASHLGDYFLKSRSGASVQVSPHYTSSIDAALTLVPEEDTRNFEVCLEQTKRGVPRWNATIGHMHYDAFEGCHVSPAIALCIAALRARQQSKDEAK